jgi:acetyl esterase/lipase
MVTIPTNHDEQTLIYKSVDGRDIELLFFPPTTPRFPRAPLLILVPGGGWKLSNARSMYDMERAACETLREQGFAVAALSYRNRKDDGVNMREMVADIFDGAGYLSRHAAVLGIDSERFYTSGHSAGAHLSLLLAYASPDFLAAERVYGGERFTVRATAPLSPPTWLPKGAGEPYLCFSVDDLFEDCDDGDYRLFSPEALADDGRGVPTIVAVGTRDELVYPANGERLADKLRAHGIRVELIRSEGGGHCFEPIDAAHSAPDIGEILRRVAAFFLDINQQ